MFYEAERPSPDHLTLGREILSLMLAQGPSWGSGMEVCMRSNENKGTAAPRLCMGCKDVVRPKSHVGSMSHPRLWDVRRAESELAVKPN